MMSLWTHAHPRKAAMMCGALIASAVTCPGAATSSRIVILVPEDRSAPRQVSRPARGATSAASRETAAVAEAEEPERALERRSPPGGRRTRPEKPKKGLEKEVKLLKSRHGIAVRGSYNKKDIQHTLRFARDFRPEETKGMTYIFERNRNGVKRKKNKKSRVKTLGWYSGGVVHIVSPNPDTVYHEGCHHMTMAPANKRTVGIGNAVYKAAVKLGENGRRDARARKKRQPANSTITRWYAKKDSYEFKAEFFTGLAGLERGLKLDFTIQNKAFNPPESIRKLARPIYAKGGRR
jgi:hypothetical protein